MNSCEKHTYSVIGAGSWGTALAILIAKNGSKVALWDIDNEHLRQLASDRENKKHLPNIAFPDNLSIIPDLSYAVTNSYHTLIVVPSSFFRSVLSTIKPLYNNRTQLCWATKGLDSESGGLLHQTVTDILPHVTDFAVISGPNFAKEVAAGLPTAVTVASNSIEFSTLIAEHLHNKSFRPYTSNDIIGVEIGGAVKNVLAVAAGISDGLGYGANARAGLITRGLKELSMLGAKLGGKIETFSGLACMGDLVLTCTDNQSRNRRLGIGLGKGQAIDSIIDEIGQAIEGIRTSAEIEQLSLTHNIEMPICHQVFEVIHNNKSAKNAVADLLNRPAKQEI